MVFLWLILILYSKYLFNQHADKNSNTRFGLINMNNSNHRSLWFNHSKTVECYFHLFSLFEQQNPQPWGFVKSLFGVPLCLYTCDPLHLFHPPRKIDKNRWFPENAKPWWEFLEPKAGAFCLVILILAQLVILAAGVTVSEKLQDDDQMAITLVDFREYQEQSGTHGTHGTHGSGKDSYTLW